MVAWLLVKSLFIGCQINRKFLIEISNRNSSSLTERVLCVFNVSLLVLSKFEIEDASKLETFELIAQRLAFRLAARETLVGSFPELKQFEFRTCFSSSLREHNREKIIRMSLEHTVKHLRTSEVVLRQFLC